MKYVAWLILCLSCWLTTIPVTGEYVDEKDQEAKREELQDVKAERVDLPAEALQVEQLPEDPQKNRKKADEIADEMVEERKIDFKGVELGDIQLVDVELSATKKHSHFLHGFLASISVIIVSEIGDKTFFIAAIMAMKYSRWLVFGGAISALGLMTIVSVCLGFATMIIPHKVTFYITTTLLALFGLKMLYDGYKMDPNEGQEELDGVTEELRLREEMLTQGSGTDLEKGLSTVPLRRRLWWFGPLVSPIFLQALTLTFLAEWGDRSQLTTIILGASENPLGVIIGGTLGHALCTALAVIGGKMVAQRISVKNVTLIGGVVFLLFALTACFRSSKE